MRRVLGCTMLAVLAVTLGALLGGCPGGGNECAAHTDCIAKYGATWYCDPFTWTCVNNDACVQACQGKECGQVGNCNCGTCTAPEVCNALFQCESCQPSCTGKQCGPDGCGGSCGTCTGVGEQCNAQGLCEVCTPNCGTRVCGASPNGCGNCGPLEGACPTGQTCNAMTGQCTCTPDCGARQCGPVPNGCGTSCGTCALGETCNATTGMCAVCQSQCGTRQCGPDPGPNNCGPCGQCQPFVETCNLTSGMCEGCQPECTGKVCGPDGCGGACGTCPAGEVCTAAGTCEAACGTSQCAGRNCGADPGCPGQTCGTCLAPQTCNPAGVCEDLVAGGQGAPCAFDMVNAAAGDCQAGLECLGMNPDPATMPCTQDANCADFLLATWNADCVGGGCGASFCSAPCNMGACDEGFEPQTISGQCFCIPGRPVGGGVLGDPCPFTGGVNAAADACGPNLECLGIPPDPTGAPCTTDPDCLSSMATNWNPDCVGGGCGASFCASECTAGACPDGYDPVTVSGACWCAPGTPVGAGVLGDPCPFTGGVNAAADNCGPTLECLGIPPDPTGAPCANDPDCLDAMAANWNPDCVGGGCGASFCAGPCNNGACPDGYDPTTVSGACWCVPGTPVGGGVLGDPCPFTGGVNAAADNCGPGLDCLGIPPDPTGAPCTNDPDCLDDMAANWNPDCVGGGCGASFCSGLCNNGACPDGYDPATVSGTCYCVPGTPVGGGVQGDPCPFTGGVNGEADTCGPNLACLGIPAGATQPACPGGDADCLSSYPEYYNPDCVNGRCGVSFCSKPCGTGRTCDPGYNPQDIGTSGCYCIPTDPVGTSQAGDPCPFGSVNAAADYCADGLSCLGVYADAETPACTTDANCTEGAEPFAQPWHNPDCQGGHCGLSFCSPLCNQGACPTGFAPIDVGGTCYCEPTE